MLSHSDCMVVFFLWNVVVRTKIKHSWYTTSWWAFMSMSFLAGSHPRNPGASIYLLMPRKGRSNHCWDVGSVTAEERLESKSWQTSKIKILATWYWRILDSEIVCLWWLKCVSLFSFFYPKLALHASSGDETQNPMQSVNMNYSKTVIERHIRHFLKVHTGSWIQYYSHLPCFSRSSLVLVNSRTCACAEWPQWRGR